MTFDNLQKRNRWIKGGTLKALSLSALFLFSFLFLINLTSAWNFASSDDYSLINWTRYTTYQNVTNYTETDPVWTADKSSYTLLSVLNNGSYLNPEGTDTFIGNYSTFLTHITYDDVMNGTLKDYFDGLYIGIGTETESKWNANYSTFLLNNISITNALNTKLGISQWNATNTSYALLTELNNGSYLNVDTNIGNWTNDKSSYTLLSVLNNGSYLNTASTDTFITNYSTFLTHITWAEVMNGTIAKSSELNNGSYLNLDWLLKSQWNSTNESYMTLDNFTIQNQSLINYILYVNSTNGAGSGVYDDAWINDTVDAKILIQNTSINNYITVQNDSLVNYVGVANTSLYQILMNGSFLNTAASDTFIGNYSTFLTHITYDDVMNGTLKTYFDGLYPLITTLVDRLGNWSADKSSYTSLEVLNNGSYLNYPWNSTNTSYALNSELNNGSYLNVDTGIGNWTNDKPSYTLLSVLNNGSYLNSATTDTFIANYSTFLTHITWANVMNGTLVKSSELNNGTYFRTSQWNATNISYMEGSNFTIQNTSMKNYVDSQNTTQTNHINTKLSLSGGTMTGNISLSNSGVRLTNGTQNTAVIYHNGTGWIIRG